MHWGRDTLFPLKQETWRYVGQARFRVTSLDVVSGISNPFLVWLEISLLCCNVCCPPFQTLRKPRIIFSGASSKTTYVIECGGSTPVEHTVSLPDGLYRRCVAFASAFIVVCLRFWVSVRTMSMKGRAWGGLHASVLLNVCCLFEEPLPLSVPRRRRRSFVCSGIGDASCGKEGFVAHSTTYFVDNRPQRSRYVEYPVWFGLCQTFWTMGHVW